MNRIPIPTFLLIAAAALLAVGLIAPAGFTSVLERFVDYDGDGFTDDLPDADFDGIPDEIEFHSFFSAQQNFILSLGQMSINNDASTAPKPCAADRFGSKKFATRAISTTRSDFDAGFGSGLGLGGGLGGGGACAGGVCF